MNKEVIMKKKGSALVFSVLILAFFLAISLNIYFLARKKAQRAGVKVAGEKTTNNIDMASSLGYQELLMAENFVRVGFPYDDDHPVHLLTPSKFSTYSLSDRSKLYLLEDGFYTQKYPGIQINSFIDFFSSQWVLGNLSDQKIIMGEEIDSGIPLRRMWQSSGIENKLFPLWSISDSSGVSIGGYELTSVPLDTSNNINGATATYEKVIKLNRVPEDESEPELIPEAIFKITVEETFNYSTTAGASDREITSFIVESIR